MKKKILEIIIVLFCCVVLFDKFLQWNRGQDKNLLLLKNITIEGENRPTITARKAHAAFYLNCRMKMMPDNMKGAEFIQWCRREGVHFIFWSSVEAKHRPLLLQTAKEWMDEVEVVWGQQGGGMIARVKPDGSD